MRKSKGVLRGLSAVAAAFLCAGFAYALTRSPAFSGEGYEFSAGASSSACVVRTDTPVLYKLFTPVAGESARWEGDMRRALLARYRAEVLFVEEACGVTAYYCHSPLLGGGVLLEGECVNLQIAWDGSRTAAGTPVIFGGF